MKTTTTNVDVELTPVYNVIFDSNGGTAVENVEVEYDNLLPEPIAPTLIGHSFKGWYKEAGLTTEWNFEEDKVTETITLYAKWDINKYTLTYTAGTGGSIEGTLTQTVEHGTDGSTVKAVADVGYNFTKWSDDKLEASRTDTNITGDLAVEAEFENIQEAAAKAAVETAEGSKTQADVDTAQALVTDLPDGDAKDDLQGRLDAIVIVEDEIDECFIATAAFGTKFTPAVALLRQFRDKYLLTNTIGTAFVDFYYNTSPSIANFIAGNEALKGATRIALVPAIIVAYLIMNPLLLIVFILLMAGVCFSYRRRKTMN